MRLMSPVHPGAAAGSPHGHARSCATTRYRYCGFAGQHALRLGQPAPPGPFMPGVGDLPVAVGQTIDRTRQRDQRTDPRVDTDRLPDRVQPADRLLAQNGHKPPSRRITRHRHRRRLHPLRQRTRPHNVQRTVHPGQEQLTVAVTEPRTGVLRRRPRPLPRLEHRVAGPLGEEVRKPRLQMPQRLLQRHRRHLAEETQLFGALPAGERRRGLLVGKPFAVQPVGAGTFLQCPVVDQADAAERAGKLLSLPGRRVEAELQRPLHGSCHGSYFRHDQPDANTDSTPHHPTPFHTVRRHRSTPCRVSSPPEGRGLHT